MTSKSAWATKIANDVRILHAGPVATVIDGVIVHSDVPMTEESKRVARDIIMATREVMAAEVRDAFRELRSENDSLHSKLAQFLGAA